MYGVCVGGEGGGSEITSIFHGCSPLMFGPAFVLSRLKSKVRKFILYHCSLSFNDFTNPSVLNVFQPNCSYC